jgi:hypothetical protein
MMPPERVPPGTTPGDTTNTSTPAHIKTSGYFDPKTRRPRLGVYGTGWCDGFRAGAVDALRLAGRQLPPESWHVVEALADAYRVVAHD